MNLQAYRASGSRKVLLPIVERMIHQLDDLFVDFAGPEAEELTGAIYRRWLRSGKTNPSGLRQYAYTLGVQLNDPDEQRRFREEANRLLTHLQSGYVN